MDVSDCRIAGTRFRRTVGLFGGEDFEDKILRIMHIHVLVVITRSRSIDSLWESIWNIHRPCRPCD